MTEDSDKYLAMMLEGYEKNLEGVTAFIEQNEEQVAGALNQRDDFVTAIEELKGLLGIEDDEEDGEEPNLTLVTDEETEETEESEVSAEE